MQRTRTINVHFDHAFRFGDMVAELPAGDYVVEIDEEQIAELSFVAFRHLATTMTVPVRSGALQGRQTMTIDRADLDRALLADRRMSETSTQKVDGQREA